MNAPDAGLDSDIALRRYAAGWAVLLTTVVLSNLLGFLDHPERLFDVPPNSAALERLHLLGFAVQLLCGCWLGCALIFEVRPARRACVALWLAGLAAFFAPLPTARQDVWLAPLALAVALVITLLSRAVDAALVHRT